MRIQLLVAAVLVAGALAGCSGGKEPAGGKGGGLIVTPTTGGIRGIVVDQAIVPVQGARITISGGANTTSGADGTFNFTGLEPGDYIITAGKPGYVPVQASATVEANVPDPPVVKVLLQALTTAQPYVDHFKLEGFYECAFSHNNPGFSITDSCDFVYRTGWDAANESGSPPPAPRTVQHNVNTQFIDVPSDTFSIVQEAYWSDESLSVMMILLSSTPIDNGCDCSETDYMDVTMEQPTYSRLDRFDASGTELEGFPLGERVAARGFLSWDTTSTAQNLQFTVITTLFHNTPAPEGWTFETRDQYPI